MKYKNIKKGIFKSRPNRFIANVEVDGREEVCHVKNTGRCKELLVEGATVYLECSENPDRKTKFDLVAVCKGNQLYNIDSQAPNKVFAEWIMSEKYFKNVTLIKPECKYNNSRFDFYIEHNGSKSFVEVKGVTLEEDDVLMFPDAPTDRGVKHLRELRDSINDGYSAYIVFVIQTNKAKYFTPNRKTHKEFADELVLCKEAGVNILCVNCIVKTDSLEINEYVPIVL